MDIARRITVPFEKKAEARNLGAIFNKADRCWYLPDNANEETEQILRNLMYSQSCDITNQDSNNVDYYNEEKNVTENCLQNQSDLPREEIPNTFWEELLTNKNALKLATTIQNYGMPSNSEQRTEILKFFALRKPGEYPITYDGMIECSNNFAELYPKEYVINLITKCITDGRPYTEQIKNADISEEEKALVLMILPL